MPFVWSELIRKATPELLLAVVVCTIIGMAVPATAGAVTVNPFPEAFTMLIFALDELGAKAQVAGSIKPHLLGIVCTEYHWLSIGGADKISGRNSACITGEAPSGSSCSVQCTGCNAEARTQCKIADITGSVSSYQCRSCACTAPEMRAVPDASSLAAGVTVPIPTLPVLLSYHSRFFGGL